MAMKMADLKEYWMVGRKVVELDWSLAGKKGLMKAEKKESKMVD